jgi:SAM-dependent methyltransferase
MSEGHSQEMKDRVSFLERQKVTVGDFDATGLILDIGGGGEGVIGRMKGSQVVAVDPSRRELEEAADGPLKIVMDAGDLKFLNGAFEVVTSFFTLMYISSSEHEKVFGEVFRVLGPGGHFLIWDADLPRRLDEEEDIVAFYLDIKLPDRELETGYGAKWPEQRQGLAHYKKLARQVGFTAFTQSQNGRVFHLELQKP